MKIERKKMKGRLIDDCFVEIDLSLKDISKLLLGEDIEQDYFSISYDEDLDNEDENERAKNGQAKD
jgi:hypothetical protein